MLQIPACCWGNRSFISWTTRVFLIESLISLSVCQMKSCQILIFRVNIIFDSFIMFNPHVSYISIGVFHRKIMSWSFDPRFSSFFPMFSPCFPHLLKKPPRRQDLQAAAWHDAALEATHGQAAAQLQLGAPRQVVLAMGNPLGNGNINWWLMEND